MKQVCFFVLFLVSSFCLFAQCPTGDVTFSTQAEIDNFLIDYPDCKEFSGRLRIEGNDIENLRGLSNITSINGGFTLTRNPNLHNLEGLENLTFIGDWLSFSVSRQLDDISSLENLSFVKDIRLQTIGAVDNVDVFSKIQNIEGDIYLSVPHLKNLNGLENLRTVGGDFYVYSDFLENFHGLEQLKSIDGYLRITSPFTSFEGLENLESIGGNFSTTSPNVKNFMELKNLKNIGSLISKNSYLESFEGLENIEILHGLWVTGNGLIKNFQGLENLKSVEIMSISKNNSLTSFQGLENLKSVSDFCEIKENDLLPNFRGLESLESIDGIFTVNDSLLTNFQGLENLQSIGGFEVFGNFSLQNFQGLENLESINGNFRPMGNFSLINFEGLEKLQSIGGALITRFNDVLQNFQGLESLRLIDGTFSPGGNDSLKNFQGLENLQSITGGFDTYQNLSLENFQGLENLKTIGEYSRIERNPSLINFQGLENLKSIGGGFQLTINGLIKNFHGLEGLESIGEYFKIFKNPLKNFKGLENLESIGERFEVRENSLENFTGLENLKFIGTSLEVWDNDNLESLVGLRRLSYADSLSIHSNEKLTDCSLDLICELLTNLNNPVHVENNAVGCSTPEDILDLCDDLGHLSYTVFYDSNQNGIKDGIDFFMPNFQIEIVPTRFKVISGTETSGQAFLNQGNYTALFVDNPDWNLTTAGSIDFSLSETNRIEKVTFGIYPKVLYSDLVVSTFISGLRCGLYSNYNITVKNLGTDFGRGKVWLEVDERLPVVSHPVDSLNRISWNLNNLPPGHSLDRRVLLSIPVPPEIPVGEILKFRTYFEPDGNEFIHDEIMRCAYDPNDKLVTPNRSSEYQSTAYTTFDEDLFYTVRFQNTGNDVAYDVVIRDTLDANLDPSTFKIISSSHYEVLNVSIEEERNVTFEFKDIFLPDSTTNFDGSNGYVSYLIKTKDGLPEETPIQNTASIYFDFNPPIVTNTTENVMVTELPTSSSVDKNQQLDIHLFPNPTDGKIYLSGVDLSDAAVSVYDLTGRLILVEQSGMNEIILPETTSGMLFLKIETEEGTAVKRIFKN